MLPLLLMGLLGLLLAVALMLLLPLSISVELHTGEPSVARLGLLGLDAVYRKRRTQTADRRFSPASGGPAPTDPSLERVLKALAVLLAPLRRVRVGGAEVALRGGVGDAAATATLYGAAWAALGALFTVSGVAPRLLDVEPRLDGPPTFSGRARAEMRVPVWRVAHGVFAAAITLLWSRPRPLAGEGE